MHVEDFDPASGGERDQGQRGAGRFDQEDYARSQASFLKAARASQKFGAEADRFGAMARNGLGSAYQKLGKETLAQKQFGIAKRLYPSFVEAHYNHINILILRQKFAEARKALNVAVQLAPSDRYEKFKGRLKEESREGGGRVGGVTGIIAFVVLLLLYSLYLRRRAQQHR